MIRFAGGSGLRVGAGIGAAVIVGGVIWYQSIRETPAPQTATAVIETPQTSAEDQSTEAVLSPGQTAPETAQASDEAAVEKDHAETQATATENQTAQTTTPAVSTNETEEIAEAPEPPSPAAPSFDEVRREADGMTVIAGQGAPSAAITVLLDGVDLTRTQVDRGGKFATLVMIAPDGEGHILSLRQHLGDSVLVSADQIILAPLDPPVMVATAEVPQTAPAAPDQPEQEATATPSAATAEPPAPQSAEAAEEQQQTAGATPEVTAGAVPEAAPTATPEVTVSARDEATSSATPEVTVSPAPEATSSATPEVVATATPETTASATDEAASSATPEAMASPAPEVVATATPEADASERAEPQAPITVATTAPDTPAQPATPTETPPGQTATAAPPVATPDAQEAATGTAAVAQPAEPRQVAVLKATEDGVELLNTTPPEVMDNVAIDTISYSHDGDVQLAGRARTEARQVRIYLDNDAIVSLEVDDAGRWRGDLPDVDEGIYILRVDEVAEDGTVTSRIETPFQREDPEALAEAATAQEGPLRRITVQRGNTLWAIAEDRYGDPLLYVSVFEANQDSIRDPDLIYPGQVFDLPEQ